MTTAAFKNEVHAATAQRMLLLHRGYAPIPLYGKEPPVYNKKNGKGNNKHGGLTGWENMHHVTPEQVRMWEKTWPDCIGTGLLSCSVPAGDIDILNPEAANAVEALAREHFEERGHILIRFGMEPKRAFLLRTDEPFSKITSIVYAPDGSKQRIEVLGDGQQLAAFGNHPVTGKPYRWFGGEPGQIPRDDLPYVREADAQAFVDEATRLLVADYGYSLTDPNAPPKNNESSPPGADEAKGSQAWSFTAEARLHSALAHIPTDEAALSAKLGSSHDAFVKIGRAIERLDWREKGFFLWSAWCSQSPKFDEAGLRTQWTSFHRTRESRNNPVTIASVYHYAKQFGWSERQAPEEQPAADAADQKLPNPIDLWGQFDPPELPPDVLPPIIENFARERAEIMGADPAGLAMSALTVCAAAVPARIKLQVKKHDHAWKESARLWTVLIGLPSTKKTPIMREAAKPLLRMDTKLFQQYVEEKIKYDALPADERRTTRPPKQERLRIEDVTIESAQEVLRDSPEGVLCWQDELSGWFGSMDKYVGGRGAAKDRGFWLQAYNGGPYALNRIGRGAALIPNLDIDVLGGIQPDALRKVFDDTVDDGLIQRLHPLVLRPATESMDIEPTPIVTIYADLVEKLRNASSTTEMILHFDDGAQAVRQRLERKHLALAMSCESINKKLAAHLGKYDGVFARLCLIWHCIEHAEEGTVRAVSENTALRVEQFLHKFLFPHALAFYAGILGLADDHDRLAAVAGYVLARKLTEITNRDIARSVRSMRRLDKRETSLVFEQLESLGWLMRTPPPRPTDPWHWKVNPRVHERFAARAKHEAERREQDREMLATLFTERREDKQWDV